MKMRDRYPRARVLALALIAGLALPAFAQMADGIIREGEYSNRLSLADGDFLLSWSFTGDTVHFGIQARTDGWVALGIEPEQAMGGADMTIGWADGSGGQVLDTFATGPYGPHPRDVELGGSDDLLSAAAREADGFTTVEFSRKASASDRFDKPVDPTGPVSVIWAMGFSDDVGDPHAQRGQAVLEAGGGPGAAGAEGLGSRGRDAGSLYGLLLPIHGAAMSASFVLLAAGMLFPRFFKHRKWWLKIHRRVGVVGGILGVVGVGLATYTIARTTGVHLRLPHSWIGLVTVVLIVVTPVYGQLMLKIRKNTKRLRAVHRWLGRVTLLCMAATIVLGLFVLGVL